MATSRLVIVAGKGGVGKTTVAAALARLAARGGQRVTAVSIGESRLGALLGSEITPTAQLLGSDGARDELAVGHIDPEEALGAYLDDNGLASLGRRMSRSGMLDLVATATPGIKELLVLGRLRQLESTPETGVVIADAPASGHALSMLRTPATMRAMSRSGRLRHQAELALEMLSDGARTQVVLVTLAEDTPVSETIEAAYSLEEEVGVKLGPVVVNRVAAAAPECEPPTAQLATTLPQPVADAVDRALSEAHIRHESESATIARLEERLGIRSLALPDVSAPSGRVDLEQLLDTWDRAR